jgi:RNA polymerase sigma factor (sigma-70 family)
MPRHLLGRSNHSEGMSSIQIDPTDEVLLRHSLSGDLNAFSAIVSRYQSLICSLAYSRTGNLSTSQDLAQDTFLTAWRNLNSLSDARNLKAWLCGILRNLSASAYRSEHKHEALPDTLTSPDNPEATAVSQQEESLLWQTLSTLPENYREPLILFYRNDCSITEVATQLDLSEDTVRQRLSRGRALLRQELTTLIERNLTRTKPDSTFTTAVIAAISLSAPSSATAASLALTKAASGSAAAAILGPAAGLSTAWLASKLVAANLDTDHDRTLVASAFRRALRFCLPAILLLLVIVYFGRNTPAFLIPATTLWTLTLLAYLLSLGRSIERHTPTPVRSQWRLLGLPLFAISTSGLKATNRTASPACAWLAIGDLAISPLLAIGGLAIAPIAIGGITVGLVSLSLGGIALGGLALGSIAAGYWAFGMAALGWQSATGASVITLFPGPMPVSLFVPIKLLVLALPAIILAAILIPLGILAYRAASKHSKPPSPPAERLHALDALRAFALLGGILLHSTLAFVLPPGIWAVGVKQPQPFLGWLAFYLHSFRLELFFLLAGAFACLTIERRGIAAYLRSRALRIALVFAVFLYPTKFLLASLWMSVWPNAPRLPWYQLGLQALQSETFPHLTLTHLWFLYILALISPLAILLHQVKFPAVIFRFGPWPLVLPLTLLLANMRGMDVDTPDQSFVFTWPPVLLYALFFTLGYSLFQNKSLLPTFTKSWRSRLLLGQIFATVAAVLTVVPYSTELRWASALLLALAMTHSVYGWLGTFLHFFSAPSPRLRYLADSSYCLYIVHLPLVVALQLALHQSGWPWWLQVPAINLISFGILLATYHWAVRRTWLGRWLNGYTR